jgi:hypothetical protein
LHAGFAADAALIIEIDDPVHSAEQSDRRADRDARRIVAVVTAEHGKVPARIRILSLLDVFDPCTIHAYGDVVLFFARDRAGMAADAAMLINEKSVPHFKPFKSEKSQTGREDRFQIAEKNSKGQPVCAK